MYSWSLRCNTGQKSTTNSFCCYFCKFNRNQVHTGTYCLQQIAICCYYYYSSVLQTSTNPTRILLILVYALPWHFSTCPTAACTLKNDEQTAWEHWGFAFVFQSQIEESVLVSLLTCGYYSWFFLPADFQEAQCCSSYWYILFCLQLILAYHVTVSCILVASAGCEKLDTVTGPHLVHTKKKMWTSWSEQFCCDGEKSSKKSRASIRECCLACRRTTAVMTGCEFELHGCNGGKLSATHAPSACRQPCCSPQAHFLWLNHGSKHDWHSRIFLPITQLYVSMNRNKSGMNCTFSKSW